MDKCAYFGCPNQPVYKHRTKSYCDLHCYYIKCEMCGSYFHAIIKSAKYCSDACKLENHKSLIADKSYCVETCHHCGKEFVKNNAKSNQIYCSNECANECAKQRSQTRWRFVIFERDDFTCFYCGKTSYRDGSELHVDHVVPGSKGGKDEASNLVTSCQLCNLSKGDSEIRNIEPILAEVKKRNLAAKLPDGCVIKITR